jgi:hypothetical protein
VLRSLGCEGTSCGVRAGECDGRAAPDQRLGERERKGEKAMLGVESLRACSASSGAQGKGEGEKTMSVRFRAACHSFLDEDDFECCQREVGRVAKG